MGNTNQAKAKEALAVRDKYLNQSIIGNFGEYKTHQKLAMLQKLDKKYYLSRDIGGNSVNYLPHEIAEKALNLAFNFNVDVEIVRDGTETFGTSQKGGIEVTMQVKFTFTTDSGTKIIRTVYSGHKMYNNKALTKADCYKAALSKAYTVVAHTFGIGSVMADGAKKEEAVVVTQDKAYQAVEENAPTEPSQKNFGLKY